MLLGKRAMLSGLLVAGTAVPYFSSNSELLSPSRFFGGSSSPDSSSVALDSGAGSAVGLDPRSPAGRAAAAEAQPLDLSQVISFDVTPAWIMSRWPRVSAALADLDLHGYRVPLVSGTSEHDLAGSLTYYFDKQQQAQRITFHGATGDPRVLVNLVTSRYGLLRQTSGDASLVLYESKRRRQPASQLKIKAAGIVRADAPHSRYAVDLSLGRPG